MKFKKGDILTEIIRPKQIVMFGEYVQNYDNLIVFRPICSTMQIKRYVLLQAQDYRPATEKETKIFLDDLTESGLKWDAEKLEITQIKEL